MALRMILLKIWHSKKGREYQFPSNTTHVSNRKLLLLVVCRRLPKKYPFMNYLLTTLTFLIHFCLSDPEM